MKKYILSTMLIAGMLYSCNDNEMTPTVTADATNAEQTTMYQAAMEADSMWIEPPIARFLAYQELSNGGAEMLNLPQDFSLSETPRIIYGYDSRPKYYEFDVLSNSEPVATIATLALQTNDGVIEFMFENPINRDYPENLDMFEGFYPNVFWGKRGEYGMSPAALYDADKKTVINDIPSVNELDRYDQILANMDDASRQSAIQTLSEARQKQAEINTDALRNFWNNISSMKEEIRMMTDVEMRSAAYKQRYVNQLNENPGQDGQAGDPSQIIYIIPQYNTYAMKHTHWGSFCGPSALAWVYRGLYSHYPLNSTSEESYIRIYGDNNKRYNNENYFTNNSTYNYAFYEYSDAELLKMWNKNPDNASKKLDNGLFATLLTHCVKTGSAYPMYHLGLANGMKDVTGKRYGVQVTSTSRDYIKNKHLPVLIMIGTGDNFHYLVAFGVGKSGKQNYVYIMDNGSYIGSYNYTAYWRREGSNYGLRYKIVRK